MSTVCLMNSERTSPPIHTCRTCHIPLSIEETLSQCSSIKVQFPYTIFQVRKGVQQGCRVSEELLSAFKHRRLRRVVLQHLLRRCGCCENVLQSLRQIARYSGFKPFHLLLTAESRDPGLGPYHCFGYLDCGNGKTETRYNVYTYTGDKAAALLPCFDNKVDTCQTVNSIQSWLRACKCVPKALSEVDSSFQPSRVVDLGKDASCDILIRPTAGAQIAAYVCLSYCWGGTQDLVCKKESLDTSGSWVLPRDRVPVTFQDAFKVARQLGFRYVWIDSLCIIQNDSADVDEQIAQMAHIFKNANLTICASSGNSCNSGFLGTRPDYSQMAIQIRLSDGSLGTAHMDSYKWASPPTPEPLAQRAWAFQERLLSPRILEYGWRTARWSCSCDNSYSGYAPLSAAPTTGIDKTVNSYAQSFNIFMYLNPCGVKQLPLSDKSFFSVWCSIVRKYSALKFTFPEDRLAGIGGVAAELQKQTGLQYLAGLWRHERLASFLQWRVTCPPSSLQPRPFDNRAPSWSWTSINDAVVVQQSRNVIDSFSVLDCDVSGGFGKTAHGVLIIKGKVRKGPWWRKLGDCDYSKDHSHLDISVPNRHEVTMWPDCSGELQKPLTNKSATTLMNLTFVAIGRAHADNELVRGLILAEKASIHELKAYMRLGMFQFRENAECSLRDWELQILTVV